MGPTRHGPPDPPGKAFWLARCCPSTVPCCCFGDQTPDTFYPPSYSGRVPAPSPGPWPPAAASLPSSRRPKLFDGLREALGPPQRSGGALCCDPSG